WFSVVYLKDASWACHLAEESRNLFAFEWEDPDNGRKQQLRCTTLPEGFMECPNLFGQMLEKILEEFQMKSGIKILQCVGDLLISGEEDQEVREASIQLLNFLGEQGLRVSKTKLQFVQREVRYLGDLITERRRKINPERISGTALSLPKTKREIRKILELLGYCRLWIEGYTQVVKFLYNKLVEEGPIQWQEEEQRQFKELKQKLIEAPVLALPCLEKPFHIFVNT
ncbi:hypothetical protein N333_10665, partial [Nestor notabilis]